MGWGAFGGALASSALNTYERLGEEELRDMQRKQLKKELADKEAMAGYLAEAAQQKDYTGGSDVKSAIGQATKVYGEDADTAKIVQGIIANQTPEQQQATLRAYGGAEGALTPKTQEGALDLSRVGVYKNAKGESMASTEGTALSTADQYKYATKKAVEAGNIAAIEKLTPLKAMMRESDLQDKFDIEKKNLDNTLARIQGTAETGGLKGLYEAGKKEGLKLNFVEGKNGVGSRIQVLGPKGDVLETVSDVAGATQKLSDAAMNQFMTKSVGLLGSPDKVIAAMQKEREMVLKGREVDIKGREVDIKEPYYKAAANAENAKAGALNSTAEERAAGKAYIEKYNALTPEQKNSPEGRALLEQAEGAMAARSGDVARIRANTPLGKAEAGYEVAAKEAAKLGEPLPSYDKYMAGRGFAPDAVIKGEQAKIDDLVKKGKLAEAVKKAEQFNSTFKNTKIPVSTGAVPVPGKAATQTSALPNEDTTKYIRSKNGRGAYVYTPSSRGQTKAQYAAIDANQS
jgi:hypothetical protein